MTQLEEDYAAVYTSTKKDREEGWVNTNNEKLYRAFEEDFNQLLKKKPNSLLNWKKSRITIHGIICPQIVLNISMPEDSYLSAYPVRLELTYHFPIAPFHHSTLIKPEKNKEKNKEKEKEDVHDNINEHEHKHSDNDNKEEKEEKEEKQEKGEKEEEEEEEEEREEEGREREREREKERIDDHHWDDLEKDTILIRPRIQSICYHPNFYDTGSLIESIHNPELLKQHKLSFDSMLSCYHSIYYLLLNPVLPLESTFPMENILQAWSNHQDANSCRCEFYYSMPCPYQDFIYKSPDEQQSLIRKLQENLVQFRVRRIQRQQKLVNVSVVRYKALFPKMFSLQGWNWEEALDKRFISAFKGGKSDFIKMCHLETDYVYSFPLFSTEFCSQIVDELKNYETSDLPKERPNSMNNYGVILNYIGLEPLMTSLMDTYLTKVSEWLLPEFTGENTLDHHHTFMVQYKQGQDVLLDMHVDDSEVTFNVNLHDEFEGSKLAICGLQGATDRRKHALNYLHVLGQAVVHAGKHRHGALPLTNGERYNLIMWCRSSLFRENLDNDVKHTGHRHCVCCQTHKKEKAPDMVCLSKTHDSDYKLWMDKFKKVENYT